MSGRESTSRPRSQDNRTSTDPPRRAPRPRERFDRILVNGAAPAIPSSLASLLAPEGRLVGALTIEGIPRLHRSDRTTQGDLREELGGALRLSPLLSGVAQAL